MVPTYEQIFDFQAGDVLVYKSFGFVDIMLPDIYSQHLIYDVKRTGDSISVFYDQVWRREIKRVGIDPATGRVDFTKIYVDRIETGIDSGMVQVYRRADYPWVGVYSSEMATPYLIEVQSEDSTRFEDKIPQQRCAHSPTYRYSSKWNRNTCDVQYYSGVFDAPRPYQRIDFDFVFVRGRTDLLRFEPQTQYPILESDTKECYSVGF